MKQLQRSCVILICLMAVVFCFTGCKNKDRDTRIKELENSSTNQSESLKSANEKNAPLTQDQKDAKTQADVINGKSTYPYNVRKDRKSFDAKNIDIVVGDDYYATQINDWFINPTAYAGKTVEIEGYYIDLGDYKLVGRFGPTCPYCMGGYVSFEFKGDQDLSKLKNKESWIKIQGILRQGHNTVFGPFQYIEAINVEKMPEVGKATVVN